LVTFIYQRLLIFWGFEIENYWIFYFPDSKSLNLYRKLAIVSLGFRI